MKKNEIFTFKDSKGVEVTGIVLCIYSQWIYDDLSEKEVLHICYAQNKLFTYLQNVIYSDSFQSNETIVSSRVGNILCEYCIIPELDKLISQYISEHLKCNKTEYFRKGYNTCYECIDKQIAQAEPLPEMYNI